MHRPDLIVLMVGGNDAMKIGKRWTNLRRVRRDHERVIDLLREAAPGADCLLWSPMDAAARKRKRIVSKPWLVEVRDMQRKVALKKGCGFLGPVRHDGGRGLYGAVVSGGHHEQRPHSPQEEGGPTSWGFCSSRRG